VQAAKARDISVNDEIERRIEASFQGEGAPSREHLIYIIMGLTTNDPEARKYLREYLKALSETVRTDKDSPDWKSAPVDLTRLANEIAGAVERDYQRKTLPNIMEDKPRPSRRE
jgi:hypothetical protein